MFIHYFRYCAVVVSIISAFDCIQ